MNPFPFALAGVLFIIGILVGRQTYSDVDQKETIPIVQTPILSTEASPSSMIEQSPVPSITTTTRVTTSLQQFIYPSSTVIKEDTLSLELSSTTSPDVITKWYEQLLATMGFGSTSIAKTSSNGTIENKLGASKQQLSVTITIKKQEESNITHMSIIMKQGENVDTNVRIHIQNSSKTNGIE